MRNTYYVFRIAYCVLRILYSVLCNTQCTLSTIWHWYIGKERCIGVVDLSWFAERFAAVRRDEFKQLSDDVDQQLCPVRKDSAAEHVARFVIPISGLARGA
jgi:hypothetical protein